MSALTKYLARRYRAWRTLTRFPKSRRGKDRLRGETLEDRRVLSTVSLSEHGQLLLELVNRARLNPTAELSRFPELNDLNQGLSAGSISSTPKQPLAPNQALVDAAVGHSLDMLAFDYFSHTDRQGQSPGRRAQNQGYTGTVGENIAWAGTTGQLNRGAQVEQRHKSLFLSPAHRENMLTDSFQEVGVGVEFGVFTTSPPVTSTTVNWNAAMVTEMFGDRNQNSFITGVAFADDVVNDDFYSLGESEPGLTIIAIENASRQRYSAVTGGSGGYGIQVPDGVYTVNAIRDATGESWMMERVVIDGRNVKVDFDTTRAPNGGTDDVLDVIGRAADGGWWVTDTLTGRTDLRGRWSSTVDWRDTRTLDFNGDGRTDVVGRADGAWWLAEATSESFFVTKYVGSWNSETSWSDVLLGDFNGDGRDDIAGRDARGRWNVSTSDGTRLHNAIWGSWSTGTTWSDVMVLDVDGNNIDDIAGRAADGTWWIARSQGDRFQTEYWGRWSNAVGWGQVQVADVDGDAREDIVGRVTSDGTWWVARSTGQQFHVAAWGNWSTSVKWSDVMVADADGDGRDDLVGRALGTWWVARSTGSRFDNQYWGRWSGDSWDDVRAADLDGDGDDDIIGRSNGAWWVADARQGRFVNRYLTRWSTGTLWQSVSVGNFG